MKTGIILSLFTIVAFATAASAQVNSSPGLVRVFDGYSGWSLAPAGSSFRVPVIDLPAGKPIRIDVSAARGDDEFFYVLIGTRAQVSAPEIPCGDKLTSSPRASRSGHGSDRSVSGSG